MSSRVASAGKFTVLLTALSVYSWKAACMRICHSGEISWAVTITRRRWAGISARP